jgi:tetratricopeptide (TPR) repeat protein
MVWILAFLLFAQEEPSATEGLRALEAKNYQAAITHFKAAAEKNPKDHETLFHLALAYSLNGQEELSVEQYRKVLELKPGLYAADLNLGILLHATNPEAALPHLEAARKEKAGEFSPAFYLSEALARLGRYGDAEPHYVAATQADPKSPHAWAGLARAELRLERDKDAQAHFEKAAELDPQFTTAILELAEYYQEKGQMDSALAVYSKFPDDPGVRAKSGQILFRAGRYSEAIPHLEHAYRSAQEPGLLLQIASAYLKSNQRDKGLTALQQVVQALPQDFDARMLYGQTLREDKNFRGALQEFTNAARIKPDSQEAWSELANTQILLELYPHALFSLDKVKALGPEKAGHLFLRAIILDKMQQYEPALANYQQFLARAGGKFPDQEFQARQRSRIIQKILSKR